VAKKKKSLPRYIFSIKSLYYFRETLPPDIAEVVNKRELRYALQTGYIRISLSLVLPFCYFEDSQF
jgi:hypothetical protein|tara:strand:+ start:75 stop:272 length:198 start_codon:yes stop_codon:yes gene_type:complete